MEKINEFRIVGIKISGFKKFSEPVEFQFGNMTSITGHNAQGKTSIAEAISYAITGVPYFGGEQNLDRLYTLESKSIAVTLTIEADGAMHPLTRERIKDVTTITYDGVDIKQNDLTVMFCEKDLFLSIFNPLYFIEHLGDKGRNLIERYLPAVPHEDVESRLSDIYRKLLVDAKMTSPEASIKHLNEEIREIEESIIYAEGQTDLLAIQKSEHSKAFAAKQEEISTLSDEIDALEKKRTYGLDFAAMEDRRVDLYMRLDEAMRDTRQPDNESDIAKYKLALEKRSADQYISQYTEVLSEVSARLRQKAAEYKKADAVHSALKAGVQCPTCRQTITEQTLPQVKEAFSESMAALMNEGRELTAQLKELQEMDIKAQEVFEQFKSDDINNLQEQIAAANESSKASGGNNGPDTVSKLKSELQALEDQIENGNLDTETLKRLVTMRAELFGKRTELELMSVQAANTTDYKPADTESLKKELQEKKAQCEAVKVFITERTNLLFANFCTLSHVGLQLYDVVKSTGELKDVYRFTYDGKPYRYLSYSEKIKAGLEISELLKKLSGSNYPVFIDNGESIPVVDNIRPTGQVIISQVVKQAPLTVKPLDAPAQKAAA